MTDLFYLQDSRSSVGTGAMWWAKDGAGYTTDLGKAEQFTRDRAVRQYECRETDLPWPKAYIDERHHVGVDCQYTKAEHADQGEPYYAYLDSTWNGNDLVWVTHSLIHSSELALARVFTYQELCELRAQGWSINPASKVYIDQMARRLISTHRMYHAEALREAGLKLKKIKPQKIRRHTTNCHGCGRFLSERQVYGNCPNCDALNGP